MPLITDKDHKNKLNKLGINIKTNYIVGNKILERNTNNSINDDISSGIRCEKRYYLNNRLISSEKLFDSRIEYTYVNKEKENVDYTCPNCGMTSKLKTFEDGCPYCGTYYNMDYTDKELGNKYHYDFVLKNNIYRVITYIFDLLICLLLSYIYIKTTSRTFNSYDISKIFIFGFILSLVLYYLFYILDGYIILYPIKMIKENQNKKQIDFWKRTNINKKDFYNSINYELRKYLFNTENIIDYDILDYVSFKDITKNNQMYVEVCMNIRIVTCNNNKIKSKIEKHTFRFKKNNNSLRLNGKVNIITCPNCGSSIDATKGECSYCNTKIDYLSEWILNNN